MKIALFAAAMAGVSSAALAQSYQRTHTGPSLSATGSKFGLMMLLS